MIPFLSISLAFIKSEISADCLSEMAGCFGGFVSDIAQVNFLKLLFICLIAKKVKTRNFVQNRKKSTFFRFICSASLIESCQNSVG